jgi:O-antigen/teichoic acid export membrane protein
MYREIGDSPVTLILIMTSITKNILYLVFCTGPDLSGTTGDSPYLTRVLSVPDFAALGFAQAVIQYFILITDYGFGITATRLIAINSRDKLAVSGVVANTLAVKLILSAAGGLACLLLIAVFADVQQHAVLFLACFIGVLGNALFPDLVISGLRENAGARLITAASRLLPLPLVFVLVKTTDDLVMAAVLQNIPVLSPL